MLAHVWLALITFWHSAFMVGGMSGLIPAAAIDYQAFKKFQSFHDLAEYGWSLAIFRWFQGFLMGGLAATIFKGLVG